MCALLAALATGGRAAPVDVNTATLAELEQVSGVGTSIASKIVNERERGRFKDWRDLVRRVSGIGEGSAAKLSAAGLTVDGLAYRGMPPAPKQ